MCVNVSAIPKSDTVLLYFANEKAPSFELVSREARTPTTRASKTSFMGRDVQAKVLGIPDTRYSSAQSCVPQVRATHSASPRATPPPLPRLPLPTSGKWRGPTGHFFRNVAGQLNGQLLRIIATRNPKIAPQSDLTLDKVSDPLAASGSGPPFAAAASALSLRRPL